MHKTLDIAVEMVEEQGLISTLREEVIDLWESIEKQFQKNRTKKQR